MQISQFLAKNLIHLGNSTKQRSQWIPKDISANLYADQAGIYPKRESPAFVTGRAEDHLHILFSLSKAHALIKIVAEVKKSSSEHHRTMSFQDELRVLFKRHGIEYDERPLWD